jgi:hypothetical protein
VYRYSDESQTSAVKRKLAGATKEGCLRQFLSVFPEDRTTTYVIADSVSDATHDMLTGLVPSGRLIRTHYKSGAFSFLHAVRMVLQAGAINDAAPIYLVEDDYVHAPGAPEAILEGLALPGVDYVTLYDHPNKAEPATGRVEAFALYRTGARYWKTTASTTTTFAATKRVLREDLDVYGEHCKTGYPFDHAMFLALGRRGRRLAHPLPGLSTHAELQWLSPFTDWGELLKSRG